MKIVRDSLGEILLDDKVYYGVHTQRAKENFDISNFKVSHFPRFIKILATIKKACALSNVKLDMLSPKKGIAISQAADEVIKGQWNAEFPLDLFQGGGGTNGIRLTKIHVYCDLLKIWRGCTP